MPTYYKTTGENGVCRYGKGAWTPGKYRTVQPPLELCARGIHYCTRDQLIHWLAPEIWTFEDAAPDTALDGGDKRVTTKGRIVERVETWNKTTARLFAADCAEAVLPIFERERPGDDRPRKAIEAARLFARGEIGADAGTAAGAAAWVAARAAAGVAAGDAAWVAAWVAAGDAAWDAAWVAAGDAAWDAAGAAARDAAWVAAGAAARDAAWTAAWSAARVAAWAAQTALLFDYLEGRRL